MHERKRRIGENEAIFRSVNERIRGFDATMTAPTKHMRIVCECGARSCTDQFEIEAAAYTEVRGESTLFIVKPGHDLPETETVVSKNEVYWIVRKDPGIPAAIARATDPNA